MRLRKTGQNTRWVAKRLAEFAGAPYKSVSWAGLKDRHAVTEQWFSLHLPGMPEPDWSALAIDGVEVLASGRHHRKLRQGQLSQNRFRLVLRDCACEDRDALESRLGRIAAIGVPNYFGPQRFGRDGSNLDAFVRQPKLRKLPREVRSFAISALRSALFNGYLSGRVEDGTWDSALDGEALLSDRPRGVAEADTRAFRPERLPAGVLWGRNWSGTGGAAQAREQAWFAGFPQTCAALEAAGCRMSRRVLRARVANLRWVFDDAGLRLEFVLGPGCYATAVVRELLDASDAALLTMENTE